MQTYLCVVVVNVCMCVSLSQPVVLRATSCWKMDWDELENNRQIFHALCAALNQQVNFNPRPMRLCRRLRRRLRHRHLFWDTAPTCSNYLYLYVYSYVAVRTVVLSPQKTQNICITFMQCWPVSKTLSRRCIHVIQMFCACWGATGAIAPHCGFSGVSSDEYCATSTEVLLWQTLGQSEEPSDLRGSLSPTARHRCTHVPVYTAPDSPRQSPIQLWTRPGVV